MKNIDIKNITKQLQKILDWIKRYLGFTMTILVLIMFTFVVFRINQMSRSEASEEALDERLAEIRTPKIDEKAIKNIEQLQERSIEVQTLFQNARENPFQE